MAYMGTSGYNGSVDGDDDITSEDSEDSPYHCVSQPDLGYDSSPEQSYS